MRKQSLRAYDRTRGLTVAALSGLACIFNVFGGADAAAADLTPPPGTSVSVLYDAHGAHHDGHAMHGKMGMMSPPPIGVLGPMLLKPGQIMLGYRYMHMHMKGLLQGSDEITPEQAALSVPNAFYNPPMSPQYVRVVPDQMDADMHMFSAAMGVGSGITLFAMLPYIEKQATMITFDGMSGADRLGTSTVETSGIGDAKLGMRFKLYRDPHNLLHAKLGLSLPTGSITETGRMLMPSGMYGVSRLGYGMQLGSGTVDFIPSLTYLGHDGKWSWGVQYNGFIRLQDDNSEGYRLGDIHELTGWLGYRWTPWLGTTARLKATTQGEIHGQDPNIVGPGIGKDPANYGGDRVDALLGANFIVPSGDFKGTRIGIEGGVPLYERANGTHLGSDWSLMAGITRTF